MTRCLAEAKWGTFWTDAELHWDQTEQMTPLTSLYWLTQIGTRKSPGVATSHGGNNPEVSRFLRGWGWWGCSEGWRRRRKRREGNGRKGTFQLSAEYGQTSLFSPGLRLALPFHGSFYSMWMRLPGQWWGGKKTPHQKEVYRGRRRGLGAGGWKGSK